MKKIVIIGANEFQNRLILKAKELGIETHVFAWQCGDIGEKTADFFYPVSITEKEKILDECRKINPQAILSVASDLAMITVSYVATRLGLICNDESCVSLTTNKFNMRTRLKMCGVYTPEYMKVSEKDYKNYLSEIKDRFFISDTHSVIVKPTDRSGSRGITKVDNFSQIETALNNAFKDSFEKACIIEEFIPGNEYSCECISFEGKHEFLAVTKKFTTGTPHFIETGHVEPSDLSNEQIELVKNEVFKALTALGVKYGASHSEFKIDNSRVKIIEIGARMGGDCIGSDLVMLSTGYDFLKMVIDVAMGANPDMTVNEHAKKAQIRFIFNESDLAQLEYIKRTAPEKIHYISKLDKVNSRAVTDSSTRFGYYILTDY